MTAARVREWRGIPGTSVRTTWLCRDKPSMKEALRQAGVPTAASAAVDTADQAREFARHVGYPLILKPRAGAGALGTTRVDNDAELDAALVSFGDADSIAIEEFVEGHEGFYDTIAVGGHVVHDWATHYYPNVLEAMRHRWISPQFITTNRIDQSSFYGEVREMGARVIRGARHRDVGDPHGVVLRTEGAAVLRDRVPAARRRARGTSTPPPTTWTSTASGPTASSTAARTAPCRASTPRGSSRCGPSERRLDPRVQRPGRHPGPLQRVGHRRPPARPRHTDPAGGGRVHGQRLRPDEAPRLRRPSRDARRRRAAPSTSMRADPPRMRSTHLLGPQRFLTTAGAVVRSLGVEGPVATITAGWEERESDDGELDTVLEGRSQNLRLFGRMMDVLEHDRGRGRRGPRAAGRRRRPRRRSTPSASTTPSTRCTRCAAARVARTCWPRPTRTASTPIRRLDQWYLDEVRALYSEAYATGAAGAQRALGPAPGGGRRGPGRLVGARRRRRSRGHAAAHDAVLLGPPPAELPVVAWSAGAMAMTRTVVLFNDFVQSERCSRGLGPRARARREGRSRCPTPAAGSSSRTGCGCRSSSGGSQGSCVPAPRRRRQGRGRAGRVASGRREGDPRRRHGRRGRGRGMTSPTTTVPTSGHAAQAGDQPAARPAGDVGLRRRRPVPPAPLRADHRGPLRHVPVARRGRGGDGPSPGRRAAGPAPSAPSGGHRPVARDDRAARGVARRVLSSRWSAVACARSTSTTRSTPGWPHGPFGSQSVAAASGYVVPAWTLPDPEARPGTMDSISLRSKALRREQWIRLYRPARFREVRRYPLLIVHDGDDYLNYAAAKTVLDNLIHRGEVAPLVAAFIPPGNRLVEYANHAPHARFVARELRALPHRGAAADRPP